jgi:nucleotide-binding universal stress UspA family protein
MGYASLMVYVDDVDSADARITLACDLAELFEANLIGISGGVPDMPVIDPYMGGTMLGDVWSEEQKLAEEEVKRAEARFRNVAGARRPNLAWRGAVDYPTDLITNHARVADLIILGRESLRPSPHHAADPGDVLMAAGRPVLVAPSNCVQKQMLEHVLVAWKDSRESRRAVVDSLPMLAKAEKITVIGIAESGDEPSNRRSIEDVTNFIRLHRISATAVAVSSNGQSAADQLLAYGEANAVGLIVLGGYGHARTREWIFGGVTQSLLRTSQICCLFSH